MRVSRIAISPERVAEANRRLKASLGEFAELEDACAALERTVAEEVRERLDIGERLQRCSRLSQALSRAAAGTCTLVEKALSDYRQTETRLLDGGRMLHDR